MKQIQILFIGLFMVLLTGVGLSSFSLKAQSFTGRNTLNELPASFRPIITPVPNSSILRIRFEHDGRGPVRMLIRDKKGNVLLDESESKQKYAGQFDLGGLAAGIYSIELTTADVRYREMIRIEPPVAGRISPFPTTEEGSLIVKQ